PALGSIGDIQTSVSDLSFFKSILEIVYATHLPSGLIWGSRTDAIDATSSGFKRRGPSARADEAASGRPIERTVNTKAAHLRMKKSPRESGKAEPNGLRAGRS